MNVVHQSHAILAIAVAPDPPPPVKLIEGALEYPDPKFCIVTETIE